ncbi:transcription elongation factor SPT4 isoform X2 [Gopherus evgoodei]|uniref:transcription elongation factor SPT4 isoform X2 n=1 Tax=Gopherus evgoodei TaxID=1825980 RepID=UPI0011CF1458|nr:transcription elongation factor SPT4 isoform X2 [Gopherus evgoodei]
MALETVPKDLRHLRACLLCSLVKTIDQFEYDGCDNCDAYLQMKGNREMVYDCTSSSFDGLLELWAPELDAVFNSGCTRAEYRCKITFLPPTQESSVYASQDRIITFCYSFPWQLVFS